jgi:hypothetical protein
MTMICIRVKSTVGSLGWVAIGCALLAWSEAFAGQSQFLLQSAPSQRHRPISSSSATRPVIRGRAAADELSAKPGGPILAGVVNSATPMLPPETRASGLGTISFLTPEQKRKLAEVESAGSLPAGEGAKASVLEQDAAGCGGSDLDWESMGDPAVAVNHDATLRRLGLCRFDVWAWDQPHAETEKQEQKKQKYSPSATQGSPGHIFWVVPAYKVDYMKNFKPLSPREKFVEWWKSEYDPLGLAAGAAESGAEYSPHDGFCGYGKTLFDYWKCFGSAELDATDSSFFGDFVFTVLMHQDPRYFRLGKGSFAKRTLYSISRVFVTYSDSGHTVFYSSALSGTVLASAVSNLYYPVQDRGLSLTLSRIGWDLGDTALYNWSAEFWPDINHKLHQLF